MKIDFFFSQILPHARVRSDFLNLFFSQSCFSYIKHWTEKRAAKSVWFFSGWARPPTIQHGARFLRALGRATVSSNGVWRRETPLEIFSCSHVENKCHAKRARTGECCINFPMQLSTATYIPRALGTYMCTRCLNVGWYIDKARLLFMSTYLNKYLRFEMELIRLSGKLNNLIAFIK